jgi:preprotein translocase subunit SecB
MDNRLASLHSWKVDNLNFKINTLPPGEKPNFNIELDEIYFKDEKRKYFIKFSINIIQNCILSMDMLFEFKTAFDIDDEFKKSAFPRINSPAIAYPYLRSFISHLSLDAGLPVIQLPTLNFAILHSEDVKKKAKT